MCDKSRIMTNGTRPRKRAARGRGGRSLRCWWWWRQDIMCVCSPRARPLISRGQGGERREKGRGGATVACFALERLPPAAVRRAMISITSRFFSSIGWLPLTLPVTRTDHDLDHPCRHEMPCRICTVQIQPRKYLVCDATRPCILRGFSPGDRS